MKEQVKCEEINVNIDSNSNENMNNNKTSKTSLQESQQLTQKSDDILPLNSAVIRRIRLNISTSLPSNNINTIDKNYSNLKEEAMASLQLKDEEVDQIESVGSVLQNTMKQKLANVLQSDSQQSPNKMVSNQRSVIDISLLSEKWSSLDCDYQQLIKTQKRNAKKPNIITFNSDLWNRFSLKMMEIREMFHQLNQSNQTQIKRSKQSLKHKKKLKT